MNHQIGLDPYLLAPVYWERGSPWKAGSAPWGNTHDLASSSRAGSVVAWLHSSHHGMAQSLQIGPEGKLCPTARPYMDQVNQLDPRLAHLSIRWRVRGWHWEQGGADTGGSKALRAAAHLKSSWFPEAGHTWAGSPEPPLAWPRQEGRGARPPGTRALS